MVGGGIQEAETQVHRAVSARTQHSKFNFVYQQTNLNFLIDVQDEITDHVTVHKYLLFNSSMTNKYSLLYRYFSEADFRANWDFQLLILAKRKRGGGNTNCRGGYLLIIVLKTLSF